MGACFSFSVLSFIIECQLKVVVELLVDGFLSSVQVDGDEATFCKIAEFGLVLPIEIDEVFVVWGVLRCECLWR